MDIQPHFGQSASPAARSSASLTVTPFCENAYPDFLPRPGTIQSGGAAAALHGAGFARNASGRCPVCILRTRRLVKEVRHARRCRITPPGRPIAGDFMFRVTKKEFAFLRSQSVTSSQWGGRRYPPYAFTEQGVAMLSSVLRSKPAVQVNIEIMRAFVRLREMLATHKGLARKLAALERRYDAQFRAVFDAIRKLMAPAPAKKRPPIGFATEMGAPKGARKARGGPSSG